MERTAPAKAWAIVLEDGVRARLGTGLGYSSVILQWGEPTNLLLTELEAFLKDTIAAWHWLEKRGYIITSLLFIKTTKLKSNI
jgi:hypothetical protein